MPKTKRDVLKRMIATSQIRLDEAGQYITAVGEEFTGAHPEMAAVLNQATQGLILVIDLLNAFCVSAWGHVPDSWEDWRAQSSTIVPPDKAVRKPRLTPRD